MTTPAVCQFDTTSTEATSSFFHSGTGNTSVGRRDFVDSCVSRQRPQSVSNSWSGDFPGWRSPSAWSHVGTRIRVSGSADVRLSYVTPPGYFRCWTEGGFLAPDALSFYDGAPSCGGQLIGTAGEIPALETRALVDALNNLKQGDLNLGIFFAELPKTIAMIANRARRIAADVRRFRRSHSRRVWRDIRNGCFRCKGSAAWLELQYGWKPLLYDIFAAMDWLNRELLANGATIRGKGLAGEVSSKYSNLNPWAGGSWAGFSSGYTPFKVETTTDHACRVSLWFRVSDADKHLLASVGLTNPLSIAWELVKYSFVVDWFAPIGPWLSTLDASLGLEFISGTRSYKREATAEVVEQCVVSPAVGWRVDSQPNLSLDGRGEYFSRTVYTKRPIPGFAFRNPVTVSHAITALALLHQAFFKPN